MSEFKKVVAVLLVTTTLAGCATDGAGMGGMGDKETVGTGAGAVIGGALAGAFLGKGAGKIVSVMLGAAVGGFIGNRIGAMLDERDKAALAEQAKQALLYQPDNQPVAWSSDHSGATATVVAENTRQETKSVAVVRDAAVAPAPGLDLIGARYAAKKAVNVQLAPAADSPVAQALPAGGVIWAVGKVQGQPWIMVAKHGKSIGYVPAAAVAPAPPKPAAAAPSTPSAAPAAQPAAYDLDAAPVRSAADLDKLEAGTTKDVVVASVTCRDVKTTATSKSDTASSTQSACRSPDGAWVLN